MNVTSMRLPLIGLFLFAGCLLPSGCAMCPTGFDDAYGGYDGKWQRSDPFHGRVGSPFSDPLVGDTEAQTGVNELETIEPPTVDDPIVEDPTAEDPTVDDPIVEDPTVDDPIVEDPMTEDPIEEIQ